MDFVNENYPGAAEAEQGVHYVCVAGKFVRGESQFGRLWKVSQLAFTCLIPPIGYFLLVR